METQLLRHRLSFEDGFILLRPQTGPKLPNQTDRGLIDCSSTLMMSCWNPLGICWRSSPRRHVGKRSNPESVIDFFALPRDILIVLLLDWLSCGEYSALDVTICSRRVRQQWLDLLKDPVLRVDLGFQQPPTLSFYAWLRVRQLQISVFHMNVDVQFRSVELPKSIESIVLMGGSHDSVYSIYGHMDVMQRFPKLTKISSRALSSSMSCNTLRDLSTLPVGLKVLEIVDTGTNNVISQCTFNLAVFALIYRYGSTLEVLHLQIDNLTSAVDSELIVQIRTRCTVLRVLRLPGISFHYHDVLELSPSHSRLTGLECKVDFSRCPDPKPTQTACLDILERFPHLEQLSVLGRGITTPIQSLYRFSKMQIFATDQLCFNMSAHNSSLTINTDCVDANAAAAFLLDLPIAVQSVVCTGMRWTGTINNDVLLAVAAKHGKVLRRLVNFHFVKSMNNETLKQVLLLCPHLTALELPNSPHLTFDAVFHISDHCRNLISLVMCIASVTDHAVIGVLKFCSKLKRLCLQNCEHITADLFDYVSALTMLGIIGSRLISPNQVIKAITEGKFNKFLVIKFPRSELQQYVSMAARLTVGAEKLKVEEFNGTKDFL